MTLDEKINDACEKMEYVRKWICSKAQIVQTLFFWEPHVATTTKVILAACTALEFGCTLVKIFVEVKTKNLFNKPIEKAEQVVTILETISDIIKTSKLDLPWF